MKLGIYSVLLSAVCLLFYCGTKESEIRVDGSQQIDSVLVNHNIPVEMTEQIEVEMPEVMWEKSIAVLPLTDKTSKMNEVLLKEVTKQMIQNLSRTGFKIVNVASEDHLKKVKGDYDYVLTGQVIEHDDKMKVEYQLEDLKQDKNIIENSEEDEEYALFSMAESMAAHVATQLDAEIIQREETEWQSQSPEIFQLYLDAKTYLAQNTREDVNTAIQKFKQVLRQDSAFTEAFIGLANSYVKISQKWDHSRVWLTLAQQACHQAIRLESSCAEAYLILGDIFLGWGDDVQAEVNFRQALGFDANLTDAWIGLGQIFTKYGLYKPSLEAYEKALSLNPTLTSISLSRAMLLSGLKQYDTAKIVLQKALDFYPNETYLHSFLALQLFYQHDLDEAFQEIQKGISSDAYTPFSHAVLGMIYASQGKLDEALSEVELEVKPYVGTDASLSIAVAAVYALLERPGQAIQWLNKAVELGYKEYLWLVNDANFDTLRQDTRFAEILERVKTEWEANQRRYHARGEI